MQSPRYTMLLDCGDTIVDENTEVKDERGATLRAELIPGADRMVKGLAERGHRLALVADGYTDTFRNALGQHGLYDYFEVRAISEEVGVSKPDPRMFTTALKAMRIGPSDYETVIMVGNNLGRDIKGANELGLISVFLRWSSRRSKTPADASEVPVHTIDTPEELLDLVDRLEAEYDGAGRVAEPDPR